jgi:phage tail-like protein
MDANGLRNWQIADPGEFRLSGGDAANLEYRADQRALRLSLQQDAPVLSENESYARGAAAKPSPVSDARGSYAWWDEAGGEIRASGFADGAVPLPLPADMPPGVVRPTDMAFGRDILWVARNDALWMSDRRGRWDPARVGLGGFKVGRLAPAPGGVWALDVTTGQIAIALGRPLSTPFLPAIGTEAFHPLDPNPDPPRLISIAGARLPADAHPVALAASARGRLAILAWIGGGDAALFTLDGTTLVRRLALKGLRFPYALAWSGEDRVAVMASDGAGPATQAFVYEVGTGSGAQITALPVGEIHPLLSVWHGGFCNRAAVVPSYLTAKSDPDEPVGLRALRAISRPMFARSGTVTLGPFDGGQPGSVWHRLYVEASIPDHTGIRVWAYASDQADAPAPPAAAGASSWSAHVVGAAAMAGMPPGTPGGAWCDTPSEMPFNTGLLTCPSEPGRSGLFTLLLQRPGTRVRRLRGRFLWLWLELVGDSQASPCLAALRLYGDRFSYRDRYLPALYRETLSSPDADAAGQATGPDFLDRLLGLFEGAMTEFEDKVANVWLLTDPATVPDAALPWLARWIGVTLDDATPAARARQIVRAAPWTARLHGTLGGLNAALELETGGEVSIGGRIDPLGPVPRPGRLALATLANGAIRTLVLNVSDPDSGAGTVVLAGGAVSRGEIVVVEGWRLRRTFATILGADLSDSGDPLTLTSTNSGNSFVGDTLFLGDRATPGVAALFSELLPSGAKNPAADPAAVAAFFQRLAYRVLVLVRQTPRTADLHRIAAAAAAASPAHVETTVHIASLPLIVGVASLVGIDTFLLDARRPEVARTGITVLGMGDEILNSGQLDARADGPVPPRPAAVIDGPMTIPQGTNFVLSAAQSQAAAGRQIARYIWTWS